MPENAAVPVPISVLAVPIGSRTTVTPAMANVELAVDEYMAVLCATVE